MKRILDCFPSIPSSSAFLFVPWPHLFRTIFKVWKIEKSRNGGRYIVVNRWVRPTQVLIEIWDRAIKILQGAEKTAMQLGRKKKRLNWNKKERKEQKCNWLVLQFLQWARPVWDWNKFRCKVIIAPFCFATSFFDLIQIRIFEHWRIRLWVKQIFWCYRFHNQHHIARLDALVISWSFLRLTVDRQIWPNVIDVILTFGQNSRCFDFWILRRRLFPPHLVFLLLL